MRALVMVVGMVSALGATARADQCQLVDDDVAEWAPKLLAKGVSFVTQCEPCGDKHAAKPKQVARVTVSDAHPMKQIAINGKDVDLAYVYVQTGKWTYTNAALLLGCSTQQVSATVTLKPEQDPAASRPRKLAANLPKACREYERLTTKLMTCDKLPQASKDALRQGFDAMADAWSQLESPPPDAVKAMEEGCKAGADALQQASTAVGC